MSKMAEINTVVRRSEWNAVGDQSSRTPGLVRVGLWVLVAVYLVIGALYAVFTPVWQVPDEPAHYNYIRSLAEGHGLPVLEPGDYDQELMTELTSRRFPPDLSVDSVEYGDHHPPLYYLLATPVYILSGGRVVPLRLFSVVLGAVLLLVAFRVVRTIFPSQPKFALAVAAFIAFIPQHLAIVAGINNDVLGELVLGAILLVVVGTIVYQRDRPWLVGCLLGAALLTKTTAYIGLAAAVVAVVLRWRVERRSTRWAASQVGAMAVAALVLSAPWFLRNGLTYGWTDLSGLARHEAVVVGQPRTSEWLSLYGWTGLISRFIQTTFRSFWGQFGWMGVVLPARIYQALALLSIVLVGGFLIWLADRRRPRLSTAQRMALTTLLVSAVLTGLSYLWYNLTFVQHQGRYLFPALIPISVAAMLGLRRVTAWLPDWLQDSVTVLLFVGMALLSVYCLFMFIVPQLAG
ncbi:MAG: glycosyltransferase family 39 protein [Anaerolineales bacterium]|nr:glycosyltransferase family 39 protein [Anaerolineales bacterium]